MKLIAGFTLIELVVTVAVIAILAMVAVPSYQRLVTTNRIASEINGFIGNLHLARTAAIENGTQATMCISTDGSTCAGGNRWDQGWIVFIDVDGDGTADPDELLKIHTAFEGSDTMTGNAAVPGYIGFTSNGFLANSGARTVKLNSNPVKTAYQRCVAISRVGRIDLRRAGEENC